MYTLYEGERMATDCDKVDPKYSALFQGDKSRQSKFVTS